MEDTKDEEIKLTTATKNLMESIAANGRVILETDDKLKTCQPAYEEIQISSSRIGLAISNHNINIF